MATPVVSVVQTAPPPSIANISGTGLTNTVAVIGVPVQPLALGIMVNVTSTGAKVVLVNVPLISPNPLEAIPVMVVASSRVQEYVVPLTLPLNDIGVMLAPEQIVWLFGVDTASGVGFTRTVAVIGEPIQPLALGVMVKVTRIGAKVVLVNVPLISPTPLEARPSTVVVASRVQEKVVPLTLPLNRIGVILAPEQIVWLVGVDAISGVGCTNTVAVIGEPGQPLALGVMVNVTSTDAKVVLVNVPLISPSPLEAMPVMVVVASRVQV